jgi:hypothetical protein
MFVFMFELFVQNIISDKAFENVNYYLVICSICSLDILENPFYFNKRRQIKDQEWQENVNYFVDNEYVQPKNNFVTNLPKAA